MMKKLALAAAPVVLGLALTTTAKPQNLLRLHQTNVVEAAVKAPVVQAQYVPNFKHVKALIFYAINQLRRENGLQPLKYNQRITDAWAQSIANSNAFASTVKHNMTAQRAAMHKIGYYFFGENLAMTPVNIAIRSGQNILSPIKSDQQLAIQLVTQYYDDVGVSDFGHRKNLLNPWFSQVGIAFAQKTDSAGVTRIYNSLDFGGVSTASTNSAINNYVAYSSANGLSANWPSQYHPLNEATIDARSGEYGIISYLPGQSVNLWNGYGDQKVFSKRRLVNGSSWKILDAKTDSHGHLWYLVGANQWLDSSYVQVYSW